MSTSFIDPWSTYPDSPQDALAAQAARLLSEQYPELDVKVYNGNSTTNGYPNEDQQYGIALPGSTFMGFEAHELYSILSVYAAGYENGQRGAKFA